MNKNILEKTNKYKELNKKKRRHNVFLRILGCAVVFCTVYSLILPAITMEKEEPKELICTLETIGVHTHSDQCYDLENHNICGYSDYVVHTHDELCYDKLGEIKCTLPVIETHTHMDSCYETVVISEESKLTDEAAVKEKLADEESTDEESTDEISTDEDEAVGDGTKAEYQTLEVEALNEKEPQLETKLICEKKEIILHKHNEECYDDNATLTCEMLEVLEHKHLDTCFKEIEQEEQQQEEQQQEEQQDTINRDQNNILSEQNIDASINAVGLDESEEGENQDINLLADVPSNATYVTNQNDLQAEINKGTSYIVLGGDFGVYIRDSEGAGYGSLSNSLYIPSGKNITIDLNGHTIWQHGNDALFTVGSNSKLSIVDSKATSETVEYPGGSVVGNAGTATLNNGKVTLTYYITDPDVTNNATGTTKETLEKHKITSAGAIIANNQVTFNVTGGTLDIQSGIVYGGTNYAIRQTAGTINLKGGYICGFTNNRIGGAIYASGNSAINLSGTVLAANTTTERGGAIAVESWEGATIKITGGVISGNVCTSNIATNNDDHSKHVGGGGIFVKGNTVINMSGGYVTNNISRATGYFDGGGGIFFSESSSLTLNGGYITGNYAVSGGGGIRSDFYGHYTKFYLNNGFISSNRADLSEGGGVSIGWDGEAYISGGYVTNNVTNTAEHWGGGGIFASNGSNMYIIQAIITENHAGGFGGGVAGCSTGRTYLFVRHGAAVYSNSADGKNTSGNSSTKNEDHIYAQNNEVFMNNGYQDYFCALNSIVEGGMLGGYSAGWHGSVDGVPVKASVDDTLVSAYIMGLTAYPTDQAKIAAQQLAKVYISGNSSYTHGGGILCNGYMIVGETDNIDLGARIELKAYKEYFDDSATKIELQDGQFTFEVVDAKTEAVIATASNDSKGAINFKERLSFTKDGQYVYYIREVKGEDTKVSYDGTVYRLTVDVTKQTSYFDDVLINGDTITINKTEYLLDRIIIEKKKPGNDWEMVSVDDNPANSDSEAIKLELTSSASFTNVYHNTKNIEVVKQWDDNNSNNRPRSVVVDLLRNGEIFDTVTLSSQNNWYHIWNNLNIEDSQGNEYRYTVKERPVDNYVSTYEEITGNEITGYWVPASSIVEGGKYIIVSPDYGQALYVTDAKIDAGFSTEEKSSVTTESLTHGTNSYTKAISGSNIVSRNIFIAEKSETNNNERILFKNLGTSSTSLLLAQDANNNFLKGTTSANYSSGLKLENGKIRIQHEWDAGNQWRYLSYENDKFTTNTSGYNAALLYEYKETGVNSITQYKITNRYIENIDFSINITKVSADNSKMTLAGAEFNLLTTGNGEPLYFVMTSQGVYEKSTVNAQGAVQKLITNNNGKLVLQGLEAGDYILRETKAPNGYEPIEDMNITLGESDEQGEIPLVVRMTIKDEVIKYQLPETGGTGTVLYTICGMLLIALSTILLLCKYRKS